MYQESDEQLQQRHKAFSYHPPQEGQSDRYRRIRQDGYKLSRALNELCPPSRELSLAQTKLEEVIMWANAAIARNE